MRVKNKINVAILARKTEEKRRLKEKEQYK